MLTGNFGGIEGGIFISYSRGIVRNHHSIVLFYEDYLHVLSDLALERNVRC